MSTPTQILFVRQRHDAKRAGLHNDYRVVIGEKAFSWASRKDFPEVGKPTILWEQPVHHAAYLNNPDITIPDGQYGAGTQVIDYAQKGNALVENDAYHLELNNGDRFLIKKAPNTYGDKAWLFLRKKKVEDKKNPYLEKVASQKSKDDIHGMKRAKVVAGTSVGAYAASFAPSVGLLKSLRSKKTSPLDATHEDVASYKRSKNLRHVESPSFGANFNSSPHYSPPLKKAGPHHARPKIVGEDPKSLLHEYGHAHSFNKTRKKIGNFGTIGKHTSFIIGQRAISHAGIIGGAYAATSDNEKVRKYAPAAVAAAATPLLVEEARATLSPAKHLLKTRGKAVAGHFLKKLAPAYGTYAVAAGTAVGAASWAKHIKNKAVAKANKDK